MTAPREWGLLIVLLAVSPAAAAQQPDASAAPRQAVVGLEPDRPDVTNGPHLVAPGSLQLETGGIYTTSTRINHDTATPTSLRIGVTNWLEARLSGDGFRASSNGDRRQSGVGNLQIGAKVRMVAGRARFAGLSILPSFNVPSASTEKGFGSGQSDFTIGLLSGEDLAWRTHVDVNVGTGWIGTGPGRSRFAQQSASASASVDTSGPLSPYFEVFWVSRQEPEGAGVLAIDSGVQLALGPRVVIDGGVERGVSAQAPDLAVFGGVSLAVGHIAGRHHVRQRPSASRSPRAAIPPSPQA